MTFQEHCDECQATAALYALGALPHDEARQFEQRLASGCPLCTAAVADCAGMADLLAMSVTPEQPPPHLRDRLQERIGAGRSAATPLPPEMTLVRQAESPWSPSPVPGVEMRPLLGDQTLMVRMQAGTVYPEHEHALAEQCYVLQGSITDSDGITVSEGDFICMAAGTTHRPIRSDTGCVLLIAYA